MDIYVNSSEEALSKCLELRDSGKANLFRGQTHDWATILPSIFRLSGDERIKADEELKYFLDWAYSVAQMNPYHHSEKSLIAIVQHYGISTNYLDLTTSPEVALLFSKVSDDLIEESRKSVIYCFSESELNKNDSGRILRINVDNLWRLEAQYGLFLEFLDETLISKLKDMAIRIHFPSTKLTIVEHELIYPQRRSHLETIIDQWFYRRTIESTQQELFANIPEKIRISRNNSYAGAFIWRGIPDTFIDWIDDPFPWIHPPIELVSCSYDPVEIIIPFIDYNNLEEAIDAISELLREPIQEYSISKRSLSIRVNMVEIEFALCERISKLLNRCWDGIRVLPYKSSEMITCLARTAAFVIGRTLKYSDIEDWPKKLWSEVEFLEVAPIGGHIDIGFVSSKDLADAFSDSSYDSLIKCFLNEAKESPRSLMKWVVVPWLIFDFSLFKRMYIEQLIPTSIDAYWEEVLVHDDISLDFWSTTFNPALLGYVTNSEYKFSSPLALEPDPEYIVYIIPEMERIDIEEAFVYCLPSVLEKGKPYQVRFTGYDHDSMILWQIDRVIEQCQWIVEVSGISVLEVFTAHKKNSLPAGLGAFEIWMIANKLVGQFNGIDMSQVEQYYDEFYKLLLYSNDDLEKRMKNWKNDFNK